MTELARRDEVPQPVRRARRPRARRAGRRCTRTTSSSIPAAARGRGEPLLVLQRHALPGADAGVRHDHGRVVLPLDRPLPGSRLPDPDRARHRAPRRQRLRLHHRERGQRPGRDREAARGLPAAHRLLLRELGHAGRPLAGRGRHGDRGADGARGAAPPGDRGRAGAAARPQARLELPADDRVRPLPRALQRAQPAALRAAAARLRRVPDVLPVLPAGVPRHGDAGDDADDRGLRHDDVPARRRAEGARRGGARARRRRLRSPTAARPEEVLAELEAERPRGEPGSRTSSRASTRGSSCRRATASTTTIAPGSTTSGCRSPRSRATSRRSARARASTGRRSGCCAERDRIATEYAAAPRLRRRSGSRSRRCSASAATSSRTPRGTSSSSSTGARRCSSTRCARSAR